MGKTAFLFPGQGAQYVGMAREFYETYVESREVFAKATQAAGFSLEDICFTENEKINETRYTQPALFTACCAILSAVQKEGIQADAAAGLSLGEYCALTAAGAITFEDGVKVVCQRGNYMQDAVPAGQGSMYAILSRKPLPIEEICQDVPGVVNVANYNCPGQQVISGENEAVEEAARKLLEAGAARAVPLNVSGPFHSPLLKGAGLRLKELLSTVDMKEPHLLFISNVTAKEANDAMQLKELLSRQVYSSVQWQQSMEYLITASVDTFVEIGPGKTLSNFMKKISSAVRLFHVETPADLEQLKKEWIH